MQTYEPIQNIGSFKIGAQFENSKSELLIS